VEIGAHQVEDVGHCLEAGVNFGVESIETPPDGEEGVVPLAVEVG